MSDSTYHPSRTSVLCFTADANMNLIEFQPAMFQYVSIEKKKNLTKDALLKEIVFLLWFEILIKWYDTGYCVVVFKVLFLFLVHKLFVHIINSLGPRLQHFKKKWWLSFGDCQWKCHWNKDFLVPYQLPTIPDQQLTPYDRQLLVETPSSQGFLLLLLFLPIP